MGLVYFFGFWGLVAACILIYLWIKYWDVLTDKKK